MTPPEVAALRAFRGAELGAALGVFYVFLRPLRPRFTALSDLAFLGALGWAWLWLAFAVCGGDLRMGYLGAMFAAGVACARPAERLLGGVFRGFWRFLGRFLGIILLPLKKILEFTKKLVASAKKWDRKSVV